MTQGDVETQHPPDNVCFPACRLSVSTSLFLSSLCVIFPDFLSLIYLSCKVLRVRGKMGESFSKNLTLSTENQETEQKQFFFGWRWRGWGGAQLFQTAYKWIMWENYVTFAVQFFYNKLWWLMFVWETYQVYFCKKNRKIVKKNPPPNLVFHLALHGYL